MDQGMKSGSVLPLLSADIEGLLNFFDEKPDWSVGHATGLVGIVGEDLNTACLQHYVKSKGGGAKILRRPDTGRPLPVNTGRKKGPWLDRWISVEWPGRPRVVFQTEIKSWSAHAFGGRPLPLSLSPQEAMDWKRRQWDSRWDSGQKRLKHPQTLKVLVQMKPPEGVNQKDVRPLLIFWEPLESRDEPSDHLFRADVDNEVFQELWVFSVSSYLRSLRSEGITSIKLEMPDAALRLRQLNQLFVV